MTPLHPPPLLDFSLTSGVVCMSASKGAPVGLLVQDYFENKIEEGKSREKKKLENYLRLVCLPLVQRSSAAGLALQTLVVSTQLFPFFFETTLVAPWWT